MPTPWTLPSRIQAIPISVDGIIEIYLEQQEQDLIDRT